MRVFRSFLFLALASALPATEERPNILWITTEDMSPTLGCYGDPNAHTPNLDQLAEKGIRYTNAFAVSPVCSPSRSCLITGVLPASQGTHQMRSAFSLPATLHGFPSYLREAGYVTSNNVKTDYNTADEKRLIEESWNESSETAHWRTLDRSDGQPFFSIFNDMTTHQSRTAVWPEESFRKHVQSELSPDRQMSAETAPLPPYYPDIPATREGMARFYDCVAVMDQNVGRRLAELEEDGLAEDTIVFFYSDHGSGMPRHKRLLHDSGMHVPLIVYFPEKYQHLAPAQPGAVVDELVSFVDFAPSVLTLAGVEPPEAMQGRAFLGKDPEPAPEYVYGSRDRVDEVMDLSRSLRDSRWLYIRNFHPHLSWNPPSVFSDLAVIRREITRHATDYPGQLTTAQAHYTSATRPVEEFYDCAADPQNLVNLMVTERTVEQEEALKRMRQQFAAHRARYQDVAALPEAELWSWIREEGAPIRDITTGKTEHRPELEAAWAAADLVGRGSSSDLLALLESGKPEIRFWGVVGLRFEHAADETVRGRVLDHLLDSSPSVRIEAAGLLSGFEASREAAFDVLKTEIRHPDWWVALRACREIELLGEQARALLPEMKALYQENRHGEGDGPFFLAFSSGAFLDRLGEETEPWNFAP